MYDITLYYGDYGTTALYNPVMFCRAIVCISAAIAACGCVSNLQAGPIDAIYAFGDSLSDVGNIFAASGGTVPGAPYVGGQFSNGPVWVQDLAGSLGLSPLKPSQLGGTDYAYGDAETGPTAFNTSPAQIDLLGPTGQLAQYQAKNSVADPNGLYVIWIGANDLSDILATSPTQAQAGADIGAVAGNIDTAIDSLAFAGAKNFLIVTVPDLGLTPRALAANLVVSGASAAASALSAAFDTTLVNGAGPLPSLAAIAATNSVTISVLNTYSLLDTIVADPSLFGLSNVTDPCYTGTYAGFADTQDPGTVCANPNSYLFWDSLHPTAAAHQIIDAAALAVLTPEPASGSLICAGLLFGFVFYRRRRRVER